MEQKDRSCMERIMADYKDRIKLLKSDNLFINNTEIAYAIILTDILNGVYNEGDKINQEQIAVDLDMSRSPVRDALIKLEEDGFVSRNKKGSYTVYKLDIGEYVQFTEYRTNIEQFAAHQAARYATDQEIDTIRINIQDLKKACEMKNLGNALFYDYEFHRMVIEASKNKYAKRFYNDYSAKMKFYLKQFVSGDYGIQIYLESVFIKHNKIYECLKKRDEKGAGNYMRDHLEWTYKSLFANQIYIHK